MPWVIGAGCAAFCCVMFGLRTTRLEFTRRPITAAVSAPTSTPRPRVRLILFWISVFLVGIFDALTPTAFGASTLYILPIVMAAAVRVGHRSVVLLSANAAALLIGITIAKHFTYDVPWNATFNRTVSLVVLAIGTHLSRLWHVRLQREELLRSQIDSERAILGDALKAIPAGAAVCFDPTLDRIIGNERLYEIFRVPVHQGISFAPDRPASFWFEQKGVDVPLSFTPLHQAMLKGEVCDNLELDLVFPDGVRKTIVASARPLFSQARLVGAVASVLDITDRRHLEDRLREASSMRDRFLAIVGHELRNPLTPILGWTEILKKDSTLKESQRKAILSIERNTLQLSTLVHDILDLSRIQNHKLEITRTALDLRAVAEQGVDSMLKAAAQRQLTLRLDAEASSACRVLADPQRLHQVMLNLIDNAIKFTPPGGQVTVRLMPCPPDRASIVVEDTGIGIPPSFLPKLFEIFTQGEDLASKRRRGLGIGLNLVRNIVQLHGGTVSASSAGAGKGARFEFTLPLAPVDSIRTPPPALSDRGWHCLVIDDDEETLQTTAAMLESLGLFVEASSNGAAALQKAMAHPPDVILCDLSMPMLDGYGVLKQARINPRLSSVPIIAISGLGMPEDRQRSRDAGFAGHLTKPVSLQVLETALREAVMTVKT